MDGHQFSTDDVRAKIQFFELKSQGLLTELEGNPIRFEKLNDCDYRITWLLNNGISVLITCEENKLQIKTNQAFEHSRILLAMKYCPVLKGIKNNVFNFTHEQFDYSLFVDQGEILNLADFDLAIASENEGLEMRFSEQQSLVSQAFLNSNMIEDYTPRNKQNHFMTRAFKPVIDPKVSLTGIYESEVFRIKNPNNEGQIYYTLDGTPPTKQSLLYQKPIVLTQEGQIRAKIFVDGMKESVEEDAGYFQSQPIKTIKGQTLPVEIKKYNPNGVETLIDGKKGTKDYRDGAWLGYHDDLDVVVDLEKATQFNQITVGFLQDTRAWIYYPKDVLVEGSLDGINFEIIEMINCDESIERKEIAVTNIQVQKAMNYRYIRVFAKNQRVCPPWSILPGEGPTFLFVDQISIL
ncbi:chitobiase/beta-hexosaminidase C-terminal domain-containing protein [Turicibacter sanguinis]|uniref:chitobiase/beta-hexosaminidase C-terminal domain-containing protein n=1 Tax=Turicibacter sanguinis TaxID=154288 RepID=UPI0039997E60